MTKRASAIKKCSKTTDARRKSTRMALMLLEMLDCSAAQMGSTCDLIHCPRCPARSYEEEVSPYVDVLLFCQRFCPTTKFIH